MPRRGPIGSPNIEYLSRSLPFEKLRDLYAPATIVAVPLRNVANRFGVTTILEAMSMGDPVVLTANDGQRECIQGPLVQTDGTINDAATADR